MRSYGKIESGFWQNPKMRQLSEKSRLLLIYLFTCHHGNSIGCFILHDGYIAADLGWSSEHVSEHVSELVSKHHIERDKSTFLTRIIGWFGHNVIENGNVLKAAAKTIKSIPDCQIKFNLIKELKEFGNEFGNRFMNELANGFLNPEPKPEPKPEPITTHTAHAEISEFQKIFDAGCAVNSSLMAKSTAVIHQWLADGVTTQDAVPEIQRLAATATSWKYFTGAVMDAKATRLNPLPQGTPKQTFKTFEQKAKDNTDLAIQEVMRRAQSS